MTLRCTHLLSGAGLVFAVLLFAHSARLNSVAVAERGVDASNASRATSPVGSAPLQSLPQPRIAVSAMLFGDGADTSPQAEELGRGIVRPDSAGAELSDEALISAPCAAGDYEQAVRFAARDDSARAAAQISMVYRRWSQHAPELAWRSALGLKDQTLRFAALEITTHAWSRADPLALADSARTASAGPERTLALTMGLRAWLEQDLEAASAWLMRWEPTGTLAAVDIDLVLEE